MNRQNKLWTRFFKETGELASTHPDKVDEMIGELLGTITVMTEEKILNPVRIMEVTEAKIKKISKKKSDATE